MMASAYAAVPTAEGSSRLGFRSYVTWAPSAITAATAASSRSCGVALAEVVEHELAREDHRGRVHLVQPLVLRRRAVGRLEHRSLRADVGARRDAEASHQAGGEVADDVAVEVREHEDVELLRPLNQAHAERVDQRLPRLELGKVLGHLAEHAEEEAVGVLHDVRLRDARDAAAAVVARVLERVADDSLGALGADRLDRDARRGRDRLGAAAVEELDDRRGVFGSPDSNSIPA